MPQVQDRLRAMATLFEKKNEEYGDAYIQTGQLMAQLFPQGITLKNEHDWNRAILLAHIVGDNIRYAKNFAKGGHPDSLDDISVYAQMLADCDDV